MDHSFSELFITKALLFQSEMYLRKLVSVYKNSRTTFFLRFFFNDLFRFLFQSNAFSGRIQGLIDDERLLPVLEAMSAQMGMEVKDVKKFFAAIYYPVHGIASLLANNSMEYDEEEFEAILNMIRRGVLKEMEGSENA